MNTDVQVYTDRMLFSVKCYGNKSMFQNFVISVYLTDFLLETVRSPVFLPHQVASEECDRNGSFVIFLMYLWFVFRDCLKILVHSLKISLAKTR
jgi:hypothetical protein